MEEELDTILKKKIEKMQVLMKYSLKFESKKKIDDILL